MATAMNEGSPRPPRVTPLQRVWLREIGIDRIWGDVDQTATLTAAPSGRASSASGQAAGVQPVGGVGQVGGATVAGAGLQATAGTGALRPRADARQLGRAPSDAVPSAPPVAVRVAPANTPYDTPVGPPSTAPASEPPRVLAGALPVSRDSAKATDQAITLPAAHAAGADVPLNRLDMQALSERVAVCTACGLCENRRHAVFGTGAAAARWMVIGEAPGEQEDRLGLPFVGKSGQLLDAMLGAVGMSRDADVFIANVIKCRPPANRNPKPEEIAACSPFLLRQIELIGPEGILVLGRFAAQTLLATDAPLGALRGRVHSLKSGGRDIPVVVSYHPAYLLRSPAEKARSWQDLRLAAAALTAAGGQPPG